MLIDIIAGARPNFMKIAPIIRALEAREAAGGPLRYRLVHTGQHYDARLSGDFFEQLGIPEPNVNLEVGSGTQAEQTAAIMVRYERLLLERRSAVCLVVGDVTSTMACAIAAQKLCIPVAHVEGGIRSGDWTMPEEINRMVTDAITNWFFTTIVFANDNLRRTGVSEERIHFVGNTMIDTLLANLDRLRPPAFWDELTLRPGEYFVVTLHRPANVDDAGALSHTGPARDLPRPSAHGKDAARVGGHAVVAGTRRPSALPGIQLFGTPRQGSHYGLRRHHRRNDRDGCPLLDPARHHRATRDREHRHQCPDRYRSIQTRPGPRSSLLGSLAQGADPGDVGRAHRGADRGGVGASGRLSSAVRCRDFH
jgi:hypothetical protein